MTLAPRMWVRDVRWRLGSQKRCRWVVGTPYARCQNQAVAELIRGRGGWWAYCGEHLYGRRIANGQVEWEVMGGDF